jgi:signal transduction histidine kinase
MLRKYGDNILVKNETKSFLNNLSIAKKIAILIVIVTIGTLLIGGVAHFGVSSMKESYNTFYDKRFALIQTLDKVRTIYTTDIQRTLLNIPNKEMRAEEVSSYITASKQSASTNWKNFLDIYYHSRDKEDSQQQAIVDALQKHIMIVNNLLDTSMQVLQKDGKTAYLNSQNSLLLKSINLLDIKISNLSEYQYKLAMYEKEKISQKYDDTQIMVFVMTLLVLLLSLFFTMKIANNFYRLLENHAKIIEKRNQENEKMERMLEERVNQAEKRVNQAVEKARGQDQIMYQHARLASMGEMIGNIAHQWRQPLNALTLLIQSFGTKSLAGKLDQEFIDKQVDEGLRLAVAMSNTIEDFRNFFSPSKEKEHFALKRSIEDTLEMSSFFCKDENIDIQVKCEEDIKVYGYANEFSQVILNFINNARDNFKLKKVLDDKRIEIVIEREAENVVIYFRDNGGGVEPSIIDRVFEPYFTTKHKATGTGIGLYMSKQIIEVQMGGEVSVCNITKEVDNKTYICAEFKIILPS